MHHAPHCLRIMDGESMAVNQDTEDSIGDYLDMDIINCMGENDQDLQVALTSLNDGLFQW